MRKPSKYLLWLIYLSSLLRLIVGAAVELGNDEVYYFTYAAYPDWSHFDHPPMVGFVIWLFSLGHYLDGQLWMRLGAILLAAANTYLIWQIGTKLKNQIVGWYAALLYTASFYTSIIGGLFIMPDTPQLFFWLLSLLFMVNIVQEKDINWQSKRTMLLLGVSIGLGMLSKYTSVYLWFGFLLFLLIHRRQWFARIELYLSGIISLLVFSPVIYWNFRNNFISFTFHEDRVNMASNTQLHWDYLGTEIGGAALYQNPIVFALIVTAVFIILFGKKKLLSKPLTNLLLLQSLPLIITFLAVSLFRRTLPHWTGPGYIALMLLTAAVLAHINENKTKIWPPGLVLAVSLFTIGILATGFHVNRGLVPLQKMGGDPTLDMYGWGYLGHRFKQLKADTEYVQQADTNTSVLATNWFDAAHLDYYVALPANTQVMAWGSLERIHKYAWINQKRGGLHTGMNFWCFSFKQGKDIDTFKPYFQNIKFVENYPIYRGGEEVKEVYVFLFEGLKEVPSFDWMEKIPIQ